MQVAALGGNKDRTSAFVALLIVLTLAYLDTTGLLKTIVNAIHKGQPETGMPQAGNNTQPVFGSAVPHPNVPPGLGPLPNLPSYPMTPNRHASIPAVPVPHI